MATRRQVLAALAVGAFDFPRAIGQSHGVRVGMLAGAPLDKSVLAKPLLTALAGLGYREGTGMVLEYRYSTDRSRYPALAKELIARKCDVIFSFVDEANGRAFLDARTDTPVVLLAFDYDPVERGIVRSYARPGGNITGVYNAAGLFVTKRLEIAREVLPKARRFLVLSDRFNADHLAVLKKAAAGRVELTVVEFAKSPYDFRAAFEAGRRERVDAVWLHTSPEFVQRREELSALLLSHRLPGFTGTVMGSSPGMLVGFGHDQSRGVQRVAEMAARILKGAKPGDIPIEQMDVFELVVNLRTAKALGVKVPQSAIARATRVIE